MISPYTDLDEEQGMYHEEAMKAAMQNLQPSAPVDKKSALNMVKAVRSTPEWQQQSQGLDQLQHLINLDAQNNAKKMSVDLSPLGAYFDYQNAQSGKPTNIAKSLQPEPIQQTPLRDLAELQRRRGDMTKDLTTLIARSGGGGSTLGQDRLNSLNFGRVMGEKHKLFDNSDKAIMSLNTVVRELGDQIPSDLNRIKIQKAMVDMGGMKPALAEVNMEAGNQSYLNRMNKVWTKAIEGQELTTDDIKEFWESSRSSLKAMQAERRQKADQLKAIANEYGVSPEKLKKIIHQQYVDYGAGDSLEGMSEEPPIKGAHGVAPSPQAPKGPSADEAWAKRQAAKKQ